VDLIAGSLHDYLGGDEVIDSTDSSVISLAAELRGSSSTDEEYARLAYTWVRDEVGHSLDVSDPRVSVSASDALRNRVGLCHAKSHLLVALLRVHGIPAGLCYQRLADDEGQFQLHGLVAVWLGGSWHRIDPRGNKEGVDAHFFLENEQLAWSVDSAAGEIDYPEVHSHPAAV
jgi:transglutaminase-like putative cysteine protease